MPNTFLEEGPKTAPELKTVFLDGKAYKLTTFLKLSVEQLEVLTMLFEEIQDTLALQENVAKELHNELAKQTELTKAQTERFIALEQHFSPAFSINPYLILKALSKKKLLHKALAVLYIPDGKEFDGEEYLEWLPAMKKLRIDQIMAGLTHFFTSVISLAEEGMPTFFLQFLSALGVSLSGSGEEGNTNGSNELVKSDNPSSVQSVV